MIPDVRRRDAHAGAGVSNRVMGRLTASLLVPRRRGEVFAFFAEAGNLQRITPPWLHVSIPTAVPLASNRTFPQERLNKEIRRICVLTQINS